jgi:hypothetical protein
MAPAQPHPAQGPGNQSRAHAGVIAGLAAGGLVLALHRLSSQRAAAAAVPLAALPSLGGEPEPEPEPEPPTAVATRQAQRPGEQVDGAGNEAEGEAEEEEEFWSDDGEWHAPFCGDADDSRSMAPFVTTPDARILEMIRLADVSANDSVVDLGAGDGRVLALCWTHARAKRGMSDTLLPAHLRPPLISSALGPPTFTLSLALT